MTTLRDWTHRLLATEDSIAPAILRVGLGSVMFAHGAQKALGWFGGYGFEGTMGFLTGPVGLPSAIALLVIAIEFLGAAALVLGVGGRLAALGTAAVMVGAVVTTHAGNGFFMNWAGAQAGEGYEFHLLALALALGLTITGSGAYSVDRWLVDRLQQPAARPALAASA